MGFVVSSTCFCCKAHPTCFSRASVSNAICRVELGKANTDGDDSASINASIAVNSSSLSDPRFFGWSLCSFIFHWAASLAKSGTKRQNRLHNPKKDLSFVMAVG